MPRESYAALAAVTWMGSTRGKKPKQIEESLIKLLDDVHLSGYGAGRESAAKQCEDHGWPEDFMCAERIRKGEA